MLPTTFVHHALDQLGPQVKYRFKLHEWYSNHAQWRRDFCHRGPEDVIHHKPLAPPPSSRSLAQRSAREEAVVIYKQSWRLWKAKQRTWRAVQMKGGRAPDDPPVSDPAPLSSAAPATPDPARMAQQQQLRELLRLPLPDEPIDSGDDLLEAVRAACGSSSRPLEEVELGMLPSKGEFPKGLKGLRLNGSKLIDCSSCSLNWSVDYAARVLAVVEDPPKERGSQEHLLAPGACGWRLRRTLESVSKGSSQKWGKCFTCTTAAQLGDQLSLLTANAFAAMVNRNQLRLVSEQEVFLRLPPITTHALRLWVGQECVELDSSATVHPILIDGSRTFVATREERAQLNSLVISPEISIQLKGGGTFVLSAVDSPRSVTLLAVTTRADWRLLQRLKSTVGESLWTCGKLPPLRSGGTAAAESCSGEAPHVSTRRSSIDTSEAEHVTLAEGSSTNSELLSRDDDCNLRRSSRAAGTSGAMGASPRDVMRDLVWARNTGPLARVLRSARSLPIAALVPDGNPISTHDANTTFLAGHILALRRKTAIKEQERRDEAAAQRQRSAKKRRCSDASTRCVCCSAIITSSVHSTGLCGECVSQLTKPDASSLSVAHKTQGGRPGPISNLSDVAFHPTLKRHMGSVVKPLAQGVQILPPAVEDKAAVQSLDVLVPALPGCRRTGKHPHFPGQPIITYPLVGHFRSLTMRPEDHEWAAQVVPGYSDILRELSREHLRVLLSVDATGILRDDAGLLLGALRELVRDRKDLDGKAEDPGGMTGSVSAIGKLLGKGVRGLTNIHDSISGFVGGAAHVRGAAANHTMGIEEFLRCGQFPGGFEATRNTGTYLNEDGTGMHTDGGELHELVVEMMSSGFCSLSASNRAIASQLLEREREGIELAAMPIVPDAHVALKCVPLRGMMLAHLHVWQHASVQHPVVGRYGTAVLIS